MATEFLSVSCQCVVLALHEGMAVLRTRRVGFQVFGSGSVCRFPEIKVAEFGFGVFGVLQTGQVFTAGRRAVERLKGFGMHDRTQAVGGRHRAIEESLGAGRVEVFVPVTRQTRAVSTVGAMVT